MPGTITLNDLILDEDEQCVLLMLSWFKRNQASQPFTGTVWEPVAEGMVAREILRRKSSRGHYHFPSAAVHEAAQTSLDAFGFDPGPEGCAAIAVLLDKGKLSPSDHLSLVTDKES